MVKPVGGRGKRTPWKTKVIRVPDVLESDVNRAIGILYQSYDQESNLADPNFKICLEMVKANKLEVIQEAKKILRSRKSAKISILKLLQVIYGDGVTEKDLTD
jgi:hypothetical protein